MGPLLLLTFTLLSSYFYPGRMMDAQQSFILREVILSIEPSTNVTRGTNVTVRCKASIRTFSPEVVLRREYTIYRDNNKVYTKSSSTSEDLLYQLPEARVSNTGMFKCSVNIEGNQKDSSAKMLTVTGLSNPVLRLNKDKISEGEEVTAQCTAPGETGSFFFYFYKDSKEIARHSVTSNHFEAKIPFDRAGIHRIHCTYTVTVMPESFKSDKSNQVTVSVKEFAITPVMVISPQSKIYEGDHLNISCTIMNSHHSSESIVLYLSQGTKLLSRGVTEVNHNMVALAKDPGDFECSLEMVGVTKVITKTVSVTELFSVPTLTMSVAEVFQKDHLTLICESEHVASERLSSGELRYSLDPPESSLTQRRTGVFEGKALQHDFNYTCVAQAKGIMKRSQTLTVRPKVLVSTPKISVIGRVVLGQRFKILCQSDTGSLPINYTLLKDDNELSTISIRMPSQKAYFTVTISKSNEITKYRCQARNSHRDAPFSTRLNTTVIVPLSQPFLTIRPDLSDMSEGNPLLLICGVEGTPPVTFKWYREDREQPLITKISDLLSLDYQIERLSKEDSGKYYCEAVNHDNNVVRSEVVNIEVHLAFWKKALIGGFCLLVVLVLVGVVCALYFKSKRARVDRAVDSVWSKRPPEAASDEVSSVLSSEPDVEYTEVVHPQPVDPARVPLRKGTDTVYSELKNSPHSAADPHDYGSVKYAELNGEQPEISHYSPEVNNYQDLPLPVD